MNGSLFGRTYFEMSLHLHLSIILKKCVLMNKSWEISLKHDFLPWNRSTLILYGHLKVFFNGFELIDYA